MKVNTNPQHDQILILLKLLCLSNNNNQKAHQQQKMSRLLPFALGAITGTTFSYYYLRRDVYNTSRALESTIMDTHNFVKQAVSEAEQLEKRIAALEKQSSEQGSQITTSTTNLARLSKKVKQIVDVIESTKDQ